MPPFGLDQPSTGPPVGLIIGVIAAIFGLAVVGIIFRVLRGPRYRRPRQNQLTSTNVNIRLMQSTPQPGLGFDVNSHHHHHHHHTHPPPPAYSPYDSSMPSGTHHGGY
ncbi:hypothetical protein BDQ17DRAFT_1429831 [Cyathus striatus]|nr:hypothetical protein BDQ17DRAFT_1429831 [Cyathus striatus]